MSAAYIIDAVRTPRAKAKPQSSALYQIHPQNLLAQLIDSLLVRHQLNGADVDDLVAGCVSQINDQGANLARNAVLASKLPITVTGTTVNRFCGSGLQAVNFGLLGVLSGMQDLVMTGGVESMSRVPIGSDGGGTDGNNQVLQKIHAQVPQGISADLIATLENFSRETLDQFALESHRKASRAQSQGWFGRSIVPVMNPEDGKLLLDKDDNVRPDASLEKLATLAGAFEKLGQMPVGPKGETMDQVALWKYPQVKAIKHQHTAGNSSAIVDGAAAVLIASEKYVKEKGMKPRAKVRSVATLGDEPVIMLTAPTPTAKKALAKAGMSTKNVDLWEINEAFATVPLQIMRQLDLDPERVNVNGGAIALGHPLGATGAMLLGTALDELERRNLSTALITLCIGGGQGIATIIERV